MAKRPKRTGKYATSGKTVKIAVTAKNKRFLHTLNGYAEHMKASYTFSASHKLPGSKGRLREAVVTEFLKAFMSRRFNVASNVFAVARNGHEHERELDIVIHDSSIGGFWSLDRFGENSICTFEGVSLVVEVKSIITRATINDAINKHADLKKFASDNNIQPPKFVLFGFRVAPEKERKDLNKPRWLGIDTITEKAMEGLYGFDAIICPDEFCYIGSGYGKFCRGFNRGISADIAENDGPVQDELLSDEIHFRQYYSLGDSPGERLLAFATFAAHSAGDDISVQGMLSAALYPKHNPIFPELDESDIIAAYEASF